ncbi:hypothetical protein HJC23_003461 [Cyclotella cryptica]|uniref:Enoyl reductase (ER) domain-containing protein n=1 Tax=Cyclotella cryptica TaxID=29204 RepID=A0ABD3QVY2_9STRA
MGFLHNKKKSASSTGMSSISTRPSKDRRSFNERVSYESLYDEYNKQSAAGIKKKTSSTPTKENPFSKERNESPMEEGRDDEQTNRSGTKSTGSSKGKGSTGLTLTTPVKTGDKAKSDKTLDDVVESAVGDLVERKSSVKDGSRKHKAKKKVAPSKSKRHGSRRDMISDSESEESYSSDSSSSASDEETELSYEESYTEDEVSDATSAGELESFDTMSDGEMRRERKKKSRSNPDHQAVVRVREHGSVEKLLLEELRLVPKVSAPNQVVVKVDASSITLQDCMIRRGKWYDMQRLPFIPGSDVVGTIHELGKEASRIGGFHIGDRVATVVPSGGNAKYITLTYDQIIRVPAGVDPVVALCLSSTYVPAREALDLARKMNTPFTGANILVIGGNGPSGLATIELAGLEGANVFATADERHHEYLAGLGAKCFPIDPKKWLPALKGKMDVVIDSVCLDGYESSALALNDEGLLVCTGMSALYTQGNIPAFGLKDIRDMKAFYVKMRAKYMMKSIYYDKMERYNNAPNEYAVSR